MGLFALARPGEAQTNIYTALGSGDLRVADGGVESFFALWKKFLHVAVPSASGRLRFVRLAEEKGSCKRWHTLCE